MRDYEQQPLTPAEVGHLADGNWPATLEKGDYESLIHALAREVQDLVYEIEAMGEIDE